MISSAPNATWKRSSSGSPQRQQQAIADVEVRIEREAAELGIDERRATTGRDSPPGLLLFKCPPASAVTEALDELEAHTIEVRRLIEEITERLRCEAVIAEGIEQAETDARARLELTLIHFERRLPERLERVTEREGRATRPDRAHGIPRTRIRARDPG